MAQKKLKSFETFLTFNFTRFNGVSEKLRRKKTYTNRNVFNHTKNTALSRDSKLKKLMVLRNYNCSSEDGRILKFQIVRKIDEIGSDFT